MKTKFRMSINSVWRQIIIFLNFYDLFQFSCVNKTMKKVVFSLLKNKNHWDLLVGFDLRPRNAS